MSNFSIIVKWSGNEYIIDESSISQNETIADLKNVLHKRTGVLPERQKLIGLKFKNKPATDDVKLGNLELKPNSKVMMVGSKEKDISSINDQELLASNQNVVNDLDIPDEVEISVEQCAENLAKIEKRIKEYKVNILNPPRPGKRLLVLDIDYTLFDHRSVAENALQLMRPYLHEFLTESYKNYDIIIWSATGLKWIEVKMHELGMDNNPNYKIVCYLDSLAMITVNSPTYGILEIKPLAVIWGKYPEYSAKNTIMFDDLRRNFLMNPQSGLRIKAYRDAHKNREKDRELYHLTDYLRLIAERENDFTVLNHRNWLRYLNNNSRPNFK